MTVDLGPATQPRRIPTQEERMTATDRIPAYPLVYPTTSTVGCDPTADTRSQARALREALAELDQAEVTIATQAAQIRRQAVLLARLRHLDEQGDRAVTAADRAHRAAVIQALEETHGNTAYLADNLAAVTIERDEFAAEVEQLRAELDRYRRCPACRQTQP